MTIRVVIADDHVGVRKGLESVFENTEIEVVGTAETGPEVIGITQEKRPDVLILDVLMPVRDGLFALEALRSKDLDTRVLIFSMYSNPTYVARAVALGAKDYVLKEVSIQELIQTIRRVASETAPVPGERFAKIRETMQSRPTERDPSLSLTIRELQVLRNVAYGLSNREIGASLAISVETVKEHIQNVLRKIDVSDRTQAAVWAVRRKIV